MRLVQKMRMVILSISAISLCMAAFCLAAAVPAGESPNPVVVIQTSMGSITVELFKDKAPKTVDNFLAYVKSDHYSGTIFHRVIKGFMIQGGGYTLSMAKKPTRPAIPNEATKSLKNERGTIAMARTGVVDSATAQFFINVANNESLNHKGESPDQFGYAVFGKVISGMDVVDKIENVATDSKGGFQNVPVTPVVIKEIVVQ